MSHSVRVRPLAPLMPVLATALGLLPARVPAQDSGSMAGMDMDMPGQFGAYEMTRESSGTSWQPDSTPMSGLMHMQAGWMTMWHGLANVIYDQQGGPRGDRKAFSNSMLMLMARRALPGGALGLRLMVSADPLMGRYGYPELFQTGETADGVHPLIDRQHPHNLLMEASGSYSLDLPARQWLFIYAAIAGEPALGPPAFMHRFSGEDNPEAPLTHHWLDSTHITYGVVTGGYVLDRVRLEASAFNGREPDQDRYAVELRAFDSWSSRLSYNPTPDLAMQISTGRLASPEQLEPTVAIRRTTASVSYNRVLPSLQWQTTLAWGRNDPSAGAASEGWLLESALRLAQTHTVFGRLERVGKDELFTPGQPLYGPTYTINALSLGYIRDCARLGPAYVGIGVMGTVYRYPEVLDPVYGEGPVSYLLFARIRL
jgi:hypothetical protein